jgi:putative ABC transport system substrate-binding protein
MRRRDLIAALGLVAASSRIAPGQQTQRLRRVGVLLSGAPNDAVFQSRLAVFQKALQQLGWIEGQNLEFSIRWGGNDADRLTAEARELVRGRPDVILAGPTNALIPVSKATNSIPIVFVQVSDPVGQGIVKSLARPGGHITGFSNLEFSLLGKWLQILKDIAPATKRAALMIHTSNAVSPHWYRLFSELAPSFGIEPIATPTSERGDVDRIIDMLRSAPDNALICTGDSFTDSPPIRAHIVSLTERYRIPVIHQQREFVTHGGLIAYGIDSPSSTGSPRRMLTAS